MALAKKCDRCKKLYEHYPNGNKYQYNAVKRVQKSSDGYALKNDTSMDLCPECMAAFNKFMVDCILK